MDVVVGDGSQALVLHGLSTYERSLFYGTETSTCKFKWDFNKAAKKLAKHEGISFETAKKAFF